METRPFPRARARETLVELVVLSAVAKEHLLVIGPPGTAKSEAEMRVLFSSGPAEHQVFCYELPSRKLRARHEAEEITPRRWVELLSPWAKVYFESRRIDDDVVLVVRDTARHRERACVVLVGASRAGARVSGEHMVTFDDRGRLLVVSLRTGAVIREARLA